MSSLWVPPRVSRELQESSERHRAEMMRDARRDATLDWWTRELRKVDPYLEMIQAREDATTPGMRPGYFHILRHNPGAPPSLLPITGEHGEFVEPTSRVLEWLREGDLQNEQAMRARRARDEEAARRRKADEDRETADRQGEMVERWKAVSETQISMNRDTPWGQNARGAAQVRAQKRAA